MDQLGRVLVLMPVNHGDSGPQVTKLSAVLMWRYKKQYVCSGGGDAQIFIPTPWLSRCGLTVISSISWLINYSTKYISVWRYSVMTHSESLAAHLSLTLAPALQATSKL